MPYMISTGSYYHHVLRIEAETNGDGVLKLMLYGGAVTDEQFNQADITIFTEEKDQPLVDRLVAAINGCNVEPANG
jgi:hypothetical protein